MCKTLINNVLDIVLKAMFLKIQRQYILFSCIYFLAWIKMSIFVA
jgi:hypothetical protein